MDFSERITRCPESLQTVIQEFQDATSQERLELLLEYAMDLPDLPDNLLAQRNAMEQVHECQTPVFLHTELHNGRVQFFFDIPKESPTVRGYAGILLAGLNQATVGDFLNTPDDVYMLLGLHQAITPQRVRGLHALMIYMRRQVQKLISSTQ